MQVQFQQLLERMAHSTLQAWLGDDIAALLQAMSRQEHTFEQLFQSVNNCFTAQEIIADPEKRRHLIDGLRPHEVDQLANDLQLGNGNAYELLSTITFSRSQLNCLADFLGVDPIEPELTVRIQEVTSVAPAYPLFDHQIAAAEKVLKFFDADEGMQAARDKRVILHMPTGSGKTRTAINVMCSMLRNFPGKTVVWLAHTAELCDQAANEFEIAWASLGNREVCVYRKWGSARCPLDDARDGLLVASLQSMYGTLQSEMQSYFSLSERTALVVMDEAHYSIARTYQDVLECIAPKRDSCLLGLTATPGRTSDTESLARFYNKKKITMDTPSHHSPIDFLVDHGYLADVVYEHIDYYPDLILSDSEKEQLSRALDLPESVVERLGSDSARNVKIVKRIIDECSVPGTKVILFACSVKHSKSLAVVLNSFGINARAVYGAMPKPLREKYISQYKSGEQVQVLVNFDLLTTGFDAPRTNCVFIARPTQSVALHSQMVGRGLRGPKANGNTKSKIITVADHLPGFTSVSGAFEHWDENFWPDA